MAASAGSKAPENGGASSPSSGAAAKHSEDVDNEMIQLLDDKEATPDKKLEDLFRLFDKDSNGYLDASEVDAIINRMMAATLKLGWDTTELQTILKDMMQDLDFDADGTVSMEEWKRGGLTTMPLLVLLGLDTTVKDDGTHGWRMKHFAKGRHCNVCLKQLVGLGKQGLACVFCKYTAHAKCLDRAPASCICTYTKSKRPAAGPLQMGHHWIDGNCVEKCAKCRKSIKAGIDGVQCRWCKVTLHNGCAKQWSEECDLGSLREHILPPTAIFPAVLGRRAGVQPSRSNSSQLDQQQAAAAAATAAASCSHQQQQQQPSSFRILAPAGSVPLLVFINPKSGGKQGPRILYKMQYLLNPRQVFDMVKDKGPYTGLNFFRDLEKFRILVCGGDGTVGWLLEAMDKYDWGTNRPAVGVLPLGTGNDMARCLRWGGGYEGERLDKILQKLSTGSVVLLDRWKINFSEPAPMLDDDDDDNESSYDNCDNNDNSHEAEAEMPAASIINNYFSIGVDAAIAHRWHMLREKHPEKFNSRLRNKAYYVEMGATEILDASCKNLHESLDIICDGCALDLSNGPALEGMALLNINSVYGGRTLWENHRKRRERHRKHASSSSAKDREVSSTSLTELAFAVQDMGDQLIEIVGLQNAMHAGMVAGGLRSSGKRLAQCSEVVIRTRRRFPMQIDGEPWLQPACTISISHMNQVPMIIAPKQEKKSGLLGLFSK